MTVDKREAGEIAVIVRFTEYTSEDPEHRIALRGAFRDLATAEEEARRLNSVARNDRVHYFVKVTTLDEAET